MSDCLFCKIVAGEIAADKVHEDDHVVAFKDINPQAPVHLLVIPRKHIASLDEASDDDGPLLGRLLTTARMLAEKNRVSGAYRIVNNCGRPAGQSVFHIHVHLLGGRAMDWPPG
jgi:histidine triad (HIT) family protein